MPPQETIQSKESTLKIDSWVHLMESPLLPPPMRAVLFLKFRWIPLSIILLWHAWFDIRWWQSKVGRNLISIPPSVGHFVSSSEGENVKRIMCMLHCHHHHILQCRNFWVLGFWESSGSYHSFQLHGDQQSTVAHLVSSPHQHLCYTPAICCHRGNLSLQSALCWLFQLLHSCMHDDRWYFHHIYIGILATEQWSVWAEVWGSNSRWILDPKCYPPSPISVSICVVGNVVGSNVSLLRWHHGLVWGIWMYSTRFSIAHCLVQCGLEPFKEIHHLLGKYFDYRGVLISSRLWSDCIR